MGNRILKKSNDPKASTFVQLHKTENPASGKQQLALSGVPDLMELAAGYILELRHLRDVHYNSHFRALRCKWTVEDLCLNDSGSIGQGRVCSRKRSLFRAMQLKSYLK